MDYMPSSGAVELLCRFLEFLFRLLCVAGFHGLDHFAVLSANGSLYGAILGAFFLALTKTLCGTFGGWHGFFLLSWY